MNEMNETNEVVAQSMLNVLWCLCVNYSVYVALKCKWNQTRNSKNEMKKTNENCEFSECMRIISYSIGNYKCCRQNNIVPIAINLEILLDWIYYPVHTIERSINFILFADGKSMPFSFICSRLFSSARGLLSANACETFW